MRRWRDRGPTVRSGPEERKGRGNDGPLPYAHLRPFSFPSAPERREKESGDERKEKIPRVIILFIP